MTDKVFRRTNKMTKNKDSLKLLMGIALLGFVYGGYRLYQDIFNYNPDPAQWPGPGKYGYIPYLVPVILIFGGIVLFRVAYKQMKGKKK
jgi:hypothetical protein